MASFLLVTWDGGGNVPPMLILASELRRRGHAVRVIGHPSQRETIEKADLPFEAYQTAKPWSAVTRRSGLRADLAYAAVFSDRRMGRDVTASVRREPVDGIVVDGLLIGVLDALARAGTGSTVLVHTLRAVMFRALVSGPLDPGSGALPSTVVHIGPLLPRVGDAAVHAQPPRVLVSLSTTYVEGQQQLLQRIIDALESLPVVAVVTSGPAVDATALRAHANTELYAVAPHAVLMTGASMVVGHGGHATTMFALAHGIPLLVIPTNTSFDQPFIGRVVAEHGLGATLPKAASVARIRETVQSLLTDAETHDRAGAVGARLRSQRDAALVAADLLEEGVAAHPTAAPSPSAEDVG